MSMFPGAGAEVYYNEAGEPMGWDYPSEPDAGDVAEAWYNSPEEPDYEDGVDEFDDAEVDYAMEEGLFGGDA